MRTSRLSQRAWADRLSGDNPTFPATHQELLERCRAAGETRPTPLLLRYRRGDWNALHQDLYGEVYFPFQVLTVLSDSSPVRRRRVRARWTSGPARRAARCAAHHRQGAFVIVPTRERPNRGRNGYHRVGLRHGVSTVTAGERTALGVIFHDAR